MATNESIAKLADGGAAVALLATERRKFLNFVRTRVRDSDAAEEILQKASLKVIARVDTLRDTARAEAWIYRILRNEIQDHYRRSAVLDRRAADLDPESVAKLPAQANSRPCPCALEEMSALRPGYSEALRTIEMENEPIAAHAARTGISLSNATVRLHRARTALRTRLEKRCGNCAGAGCFDCNCAARV